MTRSRRLTALLATALVASAACGPAPAVTPSPAASDDMATPSPSLSAGDLPFSPVAWPDTGSACGLPGAGGRIARIEAPNATTVVFTLCAPDGAFLARLAHPSLGIVDAGDLARIAADPTTARGVSGRGGYRIARWGADNVELARVGAQSPATLTATVILRWSADPAARTAALVAASVDGIDAPTAQGLDAAATDPSLTEVPRAGLAEAVLGFGRGVPWSGVRVRRAIGSGIDRDALAARSFPAGSVLASHLTPCAVPSGCTGDSFAAFNAPASVAVLQGAKFNFGATYPLTVPDAPIPGLPDPAGAAVAVAAQLAANLGITVRVATLPADQFRAAVDGGTITGLYLDGVASQVADPSAFLGALFLDHPTSQAARRATGVAAALATAAHSSDPATRDKAFGAANRALRTTVPVAPLVDLGAETVWLADVKGAAASPLGADPLGAMTAGDRGQVAFVQATPPGGGWCGAQPSPDAYRLCNLTTDGLYGFAGGTLSPAPRLATSCTADASVTVWTCRLRPATSGNGLLLDAADVVATFRAMADPTDPVHIALGDAAFSAWTDVFGASQPSASGTPSPSPSGSMASPSGSAAAPAASASAGASLGTSPGPTASDAAPASAAP